MPLKIPHTLSLLIVALRGLSGVSILILSIKTTTIYCIYKIFSFLFLSFVFYLNTYSSRSCQRTEGIRRVVSNRLQLNRGMHEIGVRFGWESQDTTREHLQLLDKR
jgi:hypothetical protein